LDLLDDGREGLEESSSGDDSDFDAEQAAEGILGSDSEDAEGETTHSSTDRKRSASPAPIARKVPRHDPDVFYPEEYTIKPGCSALTYKLVRGDVLELEDKKTKMREKLCELGGCDNWASFRKKYGAKLEGIALLVNAPRSTAGKAGAAAVSSPRKPPAKKRVESPDPPALVTVSEGTEAWTIYQCVAFAEAQASAGPGKPVVDLATKLKVKPEVIAANGELLIALNDAYGEVKAGPASKTAKGFADHGAAFSKLSAVMDDLSTKKGIPADDLCALLDDSSFSLSNVLDSLGEARSAEDEKKLCQIETIYAKLGAALKKARSA